NDYTGGTTLVQSGIFDSTLQLNGDTVLGSGPLTLFGGTLKAGTAVTISNPISLATSDYGIASPPLTFAGANPITLAGPVTLTGTSMVKKDSGGGPPVTFSGPISGTGALEKSGDNTLSLLGNNTYTGATTVADGMLVVNGSLSSSRVAVLGGTPDSSGTGPT